MRSITELNAISFFLSELNNESVCQICCLLNLLVTAIYLINFFFGSAVLTDHI